MSKNEERYLLQALEFEGALRACLYRYTRQESEVEDLLQETYARLLAAASDDPEVRTVRAFSLDIARDVATGWLRQGPGEPVRLDPDLEAVEVGEPDQPVEEIIRRRQGLSRLVGAIQRLPERCRRVLTLRKVYGYSPTQIASRLDLPLEAVGEDLRLAARRCSQVVFDPAPPPPPRRGLLGRLRHRPRAHEQGG